MADTESIRALHETRLQRLKAASEKRDVDELMTWYSQDAIFEDPGKPAVPGADSPSSLHDTLRADMPLSAANGKKIVGADRIREMYQGAYKAIPKFEILGSKLTGSGADFVVTEMRCKGIAAFDLPTGLKAGDTLDLTGASLFWWKWEGNGEWDGSLTDEAIRGWKIIHERVYFQPSNFQGAGTGSSSQD